MTMDVEAARARRRFALIQLVRLTGIAALLGGVAVLAGAVAWPHLVGAALALAGAAAAFLAPTLLARRWSSRRRK